MMSFFLQFILPAFSLSQIISLRILINEINYLDHYHYNIEAPNLLRSKGFDIKL